ncbi:MAG TPA: hypothetical protein PK492_06330, partial [Chitinophagaceae bacterium]|nr:hypothetical protein [Chitinophagaceae bacterium]
MKKLIFFGAVVIIMLQTSCRKIETDGEVQVVIVNGGGTSNTGQTITLQGRINTDTILKKQNTYILK